MKTLTAKQITNNNCDDNHYSFALFNELAYNDVKVGTVVPFGAFLLKKYEFKKNRNSKENAT